MEWIVNNLKKALEAANSETVGKWNRMAVASQFVTETIKELQTEDTQSINVKVNMSKGEVTIFQVFKDKKKNKNKNKVENETGDGDGGSEEDDDEDVDWMKNIGIRTTKTSGMMMKGLEIKKK